MTRSSTSGPERRVGRTRSAGTDLLVEVWRLLASGDEDAAQQKMLLAWTFYMDGLESEQAGRVAIRLLERLAPATDNHDEWGGLPEEFVVYRAGPEGFSWTRDRADCGELGS